MEGASLYPAAEKFNPNETGVMLSGEHDDHERDEVHPNGWFGRRVPGVVTAP
jgi:hypothetical protein